MSPKIKLYHDQVDLFDARVRASHPRLPRGFMVDLCMPPEHADNVLYNLFGRYAYWVERHGPRKARRIFVTQAIGAILSFWVDWVLQRAKLLWLLLKE